MDSFDLWLNIFGWAASICMILGYMPQAIVTMRTRNTDGISVPGFVMMGLGGIFFVAMGCMTANWPLVATNVISTISSAIVFGMKLKNDAAKRKGGKNV
ncbi:MAG: PQ-loop domain-containing transporter [Bacteroidales bacterium]|nr:PQ-loop domain-containing transporter [Bacteroidales bacterium]MDY2917764.1 PQ-loop repeat-containing protein [Muribaculaceae bacterium]